MPINLSIQNISRISYRFLFWLLATTIIIFSSSVLQPGFAQLTVAPSQPAATLAATLAGPGIVVSAATLTCPGVANGTFRCTGTLPGIGSGIVLTTGRSSAISGSESTLASTNNGAAGDATLSSLSGRGTTFDACILEFDMVPQGDTVSFRYQFGSEEYNNAVCSRFNDAFAFFISGPGITGSVNIALVPGTNVPVLVNTVNNGTPGTAGGATLSNCTAFGSGSPFTSYYVDNTGSTTTTYKGYTQVFVAKHSVIPCNTYHLKIAIVDGGNNIYDSGVFLEAGSLSAGSFSFSRTDSFGTTINGSTHTLVRGCSGGTIRVISSEPVTANTVLRYTVSGTATAGTDYTAVSDSVVIPAGNSFDTFSIAALLAGSGSRSATIYLQSPYSCGVVDSFVVNIIDAPSLSILTPDTTVCGGSGFRVRVAGSPGLVYTWSPAGSLSNPNVAQPVATPSASATYRVSANFPNSGCAPLNDSFRVDLGSASINLNTKDTNICLGRSVQLIATSTDSLTYSWSPAASLNNASISNPIATPTADQTYIVSAASADGCIARDTVTVHTTLISVNILNRDTAICKGGAVQILTSIASGVAGATIQWLPTAGISLSNIFNPLIVPDTSAMYYLTGSVPGCYMVLDSIAIDVQPVPDVYIGGNRFICQFDTLHINTSVTPEWYTHYSYAWSPATNLDYTTTQTVAFDANSAGATKFYVTVTTPAGCRGRDSAVINVYPGNFATISGDTAICPRDSALVVLGGGVGYLWQPSAYLADSTSGTTWVSPVTSQSYTIYATSSNGCKDTVGITIKVHPGAIVYMPDSLSIYPGDSCRLDPETNCSSFAWFPVAGLSNNTVADPYAFPLSATRYYFNGTTTNGCIVRDSVDVLVKDDALIDLPNAFLPGTSGTNREFRIIRLGGATLNYFRVFNRWGQVVFETKDINQGWDGTLNGAPQPSGVYVFALQAVTARGRIVNRTGNITLLR